nr:MAG TPA: hypothetical protein [Caudoviricetes sp.]
MVSFFPFSSYTNSTERRKYDFISSILSLALFAACCQLGIKVQLTCDGRLSACGV